MAGVGYSTNALGSIVPGDNGLDGKRETLYGAWRAMFVHPHALLPAGGRIDITQLAPTINVNGGVTTSIIVVPSGKLCYRPINVERTFNDATGADSLWKPVIATAGNKEQHTVTDTDELGILLETIGDAGLHSEGTFVVNKFYMIYANRLPDWGTLNAQNKATVISRFTATSYPDYLDPEEA